MAERITDIQINGRNLTPGMEVSLPKSPGRKAGRYRYDWAEIDTENRTILSVYGPLRSRGTAHYRLVNADVVKTVHIKTG